MNVKLNWTVVIALAGALIAVGGMIQSLHDLDRRVGDLERMAVYYHGTPEAK